MSQEDLLKLIKEETKSDGDLLQPSLAFTSNRSGGLDNNGPIPGCSKDFVISSTSSDDEDDDLEEVPMKPPSKESEDLFADVFKDNDLSEMDKIFNKAKDASGGIQIILDPPKNPKKREQIPIEFDKFDKTEDIFAHITKKARLSNSNEDSMDITKKARLPPDSNEDSKDITKDISETMKKSDHLWLKLASKWVEEQSKKKDEGKVKVQVQSEKKNKNEKSELEVQREKLIEEMKAREREERLLRIKKLNCDDGKSESIKSKVKKAVDEEEKVFEDLGVRSENREDYDNRILEGKKRGEDDVRVELVYGSSAPGFVRSGKQNVIEVAKSSFEIGEETLQKLNKDGEESILTVKELLTIQRDLAKEQNALVAERGKQERLAATITDQMYSECQELLGLFGIPWIVAPSEAEAQCAFLDRKGLTHGIITDDSDVWVFGSKKVYKNFFNQEKHVEFFSALEISKQLGLCQDKMIAFAMLTGSDYSEGIDQVGPVTALEILSEFPPIETAMDSLVAFKTWWEKAQKDHTPGTSVREKFRRLQLSEGFPNPAVAEAYSNPDVDKSEEKFSWAIPNFVEIRDYAKEKFSWPLIKIDEMLKPIIKRLSNKLRQTRIDSYFQYDGLQRSLIDSKIVNSKRAQSALEKVRLQQTQTTAQKQKEVEEKKQKAIEIFRKAKKVKEDKLKKKFKRPSRKILERHNLSESDSD